MHKANSRSVSERSQSCPHVRTNRSEFRCNSLDSTLRTALAGFLRIGHRLVFDWGDFECNRDLSSTAALAPIQGGVEDCPKPASDGHSREQQTTTRRMGTRRPATWTTEAAVRLGHESTTLH